jgi:GntR family transcriptional regulator
MDTNSTDLQAATVDVPHRENSLERDSAVSLYMQIAEQLKRDIDLGLYAAHGKLPTESELTRLFDVSRVTVRQAIARLLADGYVVTRQGKGTYVARDKLEHDLKPMRGFYDALVAQGVEPETRLIDFALSDAPEAVLQGFDAALAPEGRCCRLERLYLVDDEPFALVCAYLPPEASRLTWEQASLHPIYVILEHLLGVSVARADIRIRAQTADAAVGEALGIGAGAAVLVMERHSFGGDGQLLEHSSFLIRPENYEFTLSVQGKLPFGSSIKNVTAGRPATQSKHT